MPSRLEQLQQQFRQKLLQEREEKMIRIYHDAQQRVIEKVTRHNGLVAPTPSNKNHLNKNSSPPYLPTAKRGSPGVDRSRPLAPIQREKSGSFSSSALAEHRNGFGVSLPNVQDDDNNNKKTHGRSNSDELWATPVQNGIGHSHHQESEKPYWERDYAIAKPKIFSQNGMKRGRTPQTKSDPQPASQAVTNHVGRPSRPVNGSSRQEQPVIRETTMNGSKGAIPKKPAAQGAPQARGPAAQGAPHGRGPAAQGAPQARGPPPQSSTSGLEACPICGRTFAPDRIDKHMSVCEISSKTKRKVFNVTKMRLQGTEAEKYLQKPKREDAKQPPKSNWRAKHNEFISTIRQAKQFQRHIDAGGKASDLPPPPPSDYSDYVPCPYCGRKFNASVAERHIPKCKNIICNKKKPPVRNVRK